MTAKGPARMIWAMEMSCIAIVAVVTQVYAVVKIQEHVPLKWVHFTVGELYLEADFKVYYPRTDYSIESKSAPLILFLLF